MIVARFGPAFLEGGMGVYWMIAVFGPLLCCLLIVIWWLSASRATWKERLFGFLGLAASLAVVLVLVHPTMRGPGTTYLTLPMGMWPFASLPAALRQQRPARRTGVAVLLALAGFRVLAPAPKRRHDRRLRTGRSLALVSNSRSLDAGRAQADKAVKDVGPRRCNRDLTNPEWPGFRGRRSRGPLTRPSHLHQLGDASAEATLENPRRPGVVVFRRRGQSPLHPGTAWPNGNGGLL